MASNDLSISPIFIKELKTLVEVKKPPPITVEEFCNRSSKFPVKFPVHTGRVETHLKNGVSKTVLESQINSAYPLLHEDVLPLISRILNRKREHGRKKEVEIYKNMDIIGFINRLIKCRPVMFYNPCDQYRLMNGKTGMGGFDKIGRSSSSLLMEDLMTYDEMKIAALLAISSSSMFINSGSRHNRGVVDNSDNYEKKGIIVGQVGARFEVPNQMEWQDCIVTSQQNTKSNGYGNFSKEASPRNLIKDWAKMWKVDYLPIVSETVKNDNYEQISSDLRFNKQVYKARIRIAAETLLIEANARAKDLDKKAYVHVLGLGLGVWKLSSLQPEIYVSAFGDALAEINSDYISDINFSWLPVKECNGVKSGDIYPKTNVKIHFSKRDLHDKVPEGCLLVCHFAWDSNSLPGNEYWANMLSTSGDPAAACSSGIAELHNHAINPMIDASNLHIISKRQGLLHIADYAKWKLSEC